jgi:hypothetical protein
LISRLLSFFLVGFGYLWRERTLKGLLALFVFFIFILRFIYWGGVIPSSLPQLSLSVWRWILWGGIFFIFYTVLARQIYRLKARFKSEEGQSGDR